MIRIAVADDHAVVRKGLEHIISETADLRVTGEARSAEELLTLLRSSRFDLVVLDLTLGQRSGIDLLKHIKSEFPSLPVLILSMHAEDLFAIRALRAGAAGYLQKEEAPEVLVSAIRQIAAGRTFVSASMSERLVHEFSHGSAELLPHERLSDRELEVFRLLGHGNSVSEIAHALNLSVKTVSTHRSRIMEKTGFRNNAEVVHYVLSSGL